MSLSKRVFGIPEIHVATYSYLLHFQWELFQLPLFSGFNNVNYYDVIFHCTKATFGDVIIAIVAFFLASIFVRSRRWILEKNSTARGVFLFTGILITIGFEVLATGPLNRWEYAETMPIIPVLGVGVSPVAQWIFIPMLVVWFSQRQLLASDQEP